MEHRGVLDTFAIWVRFRQKSTWQGELIWIEKDKNIPFSNMLELLNQIDKVLVLRKDT